MIWYGFLSARHFYGISVFTLTFFIEGVPDNAF